VSGFSRIRLHELDIVRKLHLAGVPFVAGTDSPAARIRSTISRTREPSQVSSRMAGIILRLTSTRFVSD
jgi:hypothetical protein